MSENDRFLMKYFLNNKQIPEQIPDHLLEIREPTKYFVPAETICPSCSTVFDKQHDVAFKATAYGVGEKWSGEFVTFASFARFVAVNL